MNNARQFTPWSLIAGLCGVCWLSGPGQAQPIVPVNPQPQPIAPVAGDEAGDPASPSSPAGTQPENQPGTIDGLPAPEPPPAPAPAPVAPEPPVAPPPAPEAPVATSDNTYAVPAVETYLPSSYTPPLIHVGARIGVLFPQLQSELGTAPGFLIEGGYRAWKHLNAHLGIAYAQPSVDDQRSDPRLDDSYMTTTTQRELTITAGAQWRFLPLDARINGYAGLGVRIWMLETITNGEAGGADFLENRETSTRFGLGMMAGGEFRLGPGAVTAELDIGGSDLPHLITGDVATTAITTTAGYRVLF